MADVARAPQVARTYAKASGVLVIVLGRFGSAIASALGQLGQDVLAVEKSPELVGQWAGSLRSSKPTASTRRRSRPSARATSPWPPRLRLEPATHVSVNDLLIVSGHADLLERFAVRP